MKFGKGLKVEVYRLAKRILKEYKSGQNDGKSQIYRPNLQFHYLKNGSSHVWYRVHVSKYYLLLLFVLPNRIN